MEEKKFEIIKAGTRVHEKENPKHVGTVVMQAETTGKYLVKLQCSLLIEECKHFRSLDLIVVGVVFLDVDEGV